MRFARSGAQSPNLLPFLSPMYRTPPDRLNAMWLTNRSFVSAGGAARFASLLFALLCIVPLVSNSALAQTLTPLYSFSGLAAGQIPAAGLVADGAGNLYGTTGFGGSNDLGVVFEVSPSSKTLGVLHSFTGPDGALPDQAAMIIDPSGNLYGTTIAGGNGTGCGGYGCGVVFEVTPSSKTETVLHTFTGGNDGGNPVASLMADSSFNLYGTTQSGGALNGGTVFELVNSSGSYNTPLNVLYTFPGSASGYSPESNLIADSSNNLYGTTTSGGDNNGVVYKLSPPATTGAAWTETPVYTFLGGNDGSYSQAGLVEDTEGNLYGTTTLGGGSNAGVVFKITPSGNESVLYAFTGGSDGGHRLGD